MVTVTTYKQLHYVRGSILVSSSVELNRSTLEDSPPTTTTTTTSWFLLDLHQSHSICFQTVLPSVTHSTRLQLAISLPYSCLSSTCSFGRLESGKDLLKLDRIPLCTPRGLKPDVKLLLNSALWLCQEIQDLNPEVAQCMLHTELSNGCGKFKTPNSKSSLKRNLQATNREMASLSSTLCFKSG